MVLDNGICNKPILVPINGIMEILCDNQTCLWQPVFFVRGSASCLKHFTKLQFFGSSVVKTRLFETQKCDRPNKAAPTKQLCVHRTLQFHFNSLVSFFLQFSIQFYILFSTVPCTGFCRSLVAVKTTNQRGYAHLSTTESWRKETLVVSCTLLLLGELWPCSQSIDYTWWFEKNNGEALYLTRYYKRFFSSTFCGAG